ncbi:hypothetical protein VP01_726g5 [Puccinia sorghi]|uniref:Uncharacterized protein n=1 Tax=Puccinia sorghi TaxID=27349 RepID=A0A0L6UDY0_9BASI|nr:hypothetical protein VP01_726g5 [Puccinia sorghi]
MAKSKTRDRGTAQSDSKDGNGFRPKQLGVILENLSVIGDSGLKFLPRFPQEIAVGPNPALHPPQVPAPSQVNPSPLGRLP